MSRYLIVAHDTATSPALIEQVQELARKDPAREFVLLVPATPVSRLRLIRAGSRDADSVARERAEEARQAFAKAGVKLGDTRVGPGSAREAIAQEVRREPGYDGFVISSLPAEHSNWLTEDLPGEVEREYGLRVVRVELTPTEFEF